jgi:DNA-binding transcriptional LysR family regulator
MFVKVAETRSFTEAGRLLGVSSSAVGKSIARMEERLAVRLFHRSTRSITLTAEGTLFLERCRRILSELEAAEAELSQASGNPRGKLRISFPQLTSLFMPIIDDFMRLYPEVELDIDMSERMVDVIEEGFDAVIRTGDQHDSRLVARRLGSYGQVLVAAPDYLARRGTPRHPRELIDHICLLHRFPVSGKFEVWPFRREADEPEALLPERFASNATEVVSYLAQKGKGIAFLPTFIIREALDEGELLTVLDDFLDKTVTFWMLWPASRYTSPKLRVFIDHMSKHFAAQ